MSIIISEYDTFTIRIANSAESNFDYTIAYEIDSTSSTKATTKGDQGIWKDVTCNNLESGTHTITIEYRKDDSVEEGNDRGCVCIPKKSSEKVTTGSCRHEPVQ